MKRIIFLCLSLFLCQISFGQNIPLPQKKPPVEQKKPSVKKPPVKPLIKIDIHNDPLDFYRDMVYVEGGTFMMGCTDEQGNDCDDDEKPTHQVTLSSFSIGKYPVTQKQWRALMGSDPPELEFKGCDNCPVAGVSWNDIQDFLKKLNQKTGKNYRLPTEAEWEFAARGGNRSKGFKYSGSNNIDYVAWHGHNSGTKLHPVGQKQGNELGVYDMSGNVSEWCGDWSDRDEWNRWYHSYYSDSPQNNPKGPSTGNARVLRGGDYLSNSVFGRVASREYSRPDFRFDSHGFRVVLSQ